jgi:hypothetical protein
MHTLDPRSRHEVMVVSDYLFGAAYSSEGQEEDYTAGAPCQELGTKKVNVIQAVH